MCSNGRGTKLASMETTALARAISERRQRGQPIFDLISSDFHGAGFVPEPEPLAAEAAAYFHSRRYEPDPLGSREARLALAAYYRERMESGGSARELPAPENFLLTASSSEAYSLLFAHGAAPGDRVLLPLPGYPLFEDLAAYAGLVPDFYPLDPQAGWQPDMDVLESLIQARTRFLVVISPNNPTGSVLDAAAQRKITKICAEERLVLIHDEVFAEFPGIRRGRPVLDWGDCASCTINGISKACASPDLKLSWIYFRNPPDGLMAELELVYDTYLNCNALSQYLLPGLLERSLGQWGVTQRIRERLATHEAELARMLERPELGEIGERSGYGTRSISFAGIHRVLRLPPQTDPARDEELAIRILEETGCAVHPGSLYGIDEEACIVLSLLGGDGYAAALRSMLAALPDVCRRFSLDEV